MQCLCLYVDLSPVFQHYLLHFLELTFQWSSCPVLWQSVFHILFTLVFLYSTQVDKLVFHMFKISCTHTRKSHLRWQKFSLYSISLPQPETCVIPIINRGSHTLLGFPLPASYKAELWVGWGKAKIVKYVKRAHLLYISYMYISKSI